MRLNIGNKLFLSGFIVLFFIILIAVAGDIVVRILKRTSHLIVVEYRELEGIQKVSFSLIQVLSPVKTYMIEGGVKQLSLFQHRITDVTTALDSCETVLTKRHNEEILAGVRNSLVIVDSLGKSLFSKPPNASEQMRILHQMQKIIDNSLAGTQALQIETEEELNEYVRTNEIAILHSTITIILLGIILTFIVLVGGFLVIKKITSPIIQLLDTIYQVKRGDMKAKAEVQSRDEFGELAGAFNSMLERIDEVTVSRNFYNNILNSMFNGLIVTNRQGSITSLNDAAAELLEETKENLTGSSIKDLFADPDDYTKLMEVEQRGGGDILTETTLKSHKEKMIPVLFSASALQDHNGNISGYVIVIHDATEKKKIEQKLDQIRKERTIAINEAEEKERLRIATDLHDGLGQILTSVSFSLENLDSGLPEGSSGLKDDLNQAQEQIKAAISESKRISHNLIPLALKDFGLVPALSHLINQVNQQSSIRFSFDTFNLDKRIDARLEKVLFRICQESVNNILRHSQATKAYIQLIRHEHSIVLGVEDDGIGFHVEEQEKSHSGIGLASIRERISAFGGSLTIQSARGKGTELVIEVPCKTS
ncbi:MAG: PAS domain S-box protein [Bacteroidetes bacterium]|nr:PAS domain S-box protein [Bacteroidota bacterium]